MHTTQPLEYDRYFHIFNKGINGTPLFKTTEHYELFLRKYVEYIEPVAETYAWCLLGNHFHVLVKILPETEIGLIKPKEDDKRVFESTKRYNPTRQFAHLFDAYAKNFNLQTNRTGGLFETPFRRIKVMKEQYFKQLVFYIHNNPVKHGFVGEMKDYPWSSYGSIISLKPTRIRRDRVIGWFNSQSEFIDFHSKENAEIDFSPFDLDDF